MRKKALIALLEAMVAEIVAKTGGTVIEGEKGKPDTVDGGTFDLDGARALLGAAIRAHRAQLIQHVVGSPLVAANAELQSAA